MADKNEVKVKAYLLSLEDPLRTPEENWRLAEQVNLSNSSRHQSPWNFLMIVLLAFCFFLLLGLLYGLVNDAVLYRWSFLLAYYIFVVSATLIAIRLIAYNVRLRGGLLWPFSGIIKLFGSQGKTIWDFLDLIGGAALLGIIVSIISYFVTLSSQASQARLQRDRENQQLLLSYVNDITKLVDGKTREYELLNNDLKVSISARTLNTIQALSGDPLRQGDAIRFASRVTPNTICEGSVLKECKLPDNISIVGIILRNFDFLETSDTPKDFFSGINLAKSDLRGSNFKLASLVGTSFRMANLSQTEFSQETKLSETDFSFADLTRARFISELNLERTKGLEDAYYNQTIFSYLAANSAVKQLNKSMCTLIRTKRISITAVPPVDPSGLKHDKFVKNYGCDPLSGYPVTQEGEVLMINLLQEGHDRLSMLARDLRLSIRNLFKR